MHPRLVWLCAFSAAACQPMSSPVATVPVLADRLSHTGAPATPVVHRVVRETSPSRPTAPGPLVDRAPTLTSRTLAHAAAMDPRAPLRVTLRLPDNVGEKWWTAPLLLRSTLADAVGVTPALKALRTQVEALGATDVVVHQLVPQVSATVRAGDVATLARWPLVAEVSTVGSLRSEQFDGAEARRKTGTGRLVGAGVDGKSGGANGGRTRLGVVEYNGTGQNWLGRDFYGWRDEVDADSRIVSVLDCRTGACRPTNEDASNDTHGTKVAWLALGSIEEGQDPGYPGTRTVDQVQRSGQAPEAELFYYAIDTCDDITSALEHMVFFGVDVANFSFGEDSARCDPTYDCGGVNTALTRALEAGILVVKSAGNSGYNDPACKLTWPAFRTEVLSVTAMDSWVDWLPYQELGRWPFSSLGGMQARALSGHALELSGVGLAAPGVWRHNFHLAPGTYNEDGRIEGTSFAAPAVSGAALLLKQAMAEQGWPADDARLVMLNLLLTADAWNGEPGDTTPLRAGISRSSGFGRVNVRAPADWDLPAPWGWGWRAFTIHQGETHIWPVGDEGPEDRDVAQWTAALLWFEPDLQQVSDVTLSVHNACPPHAPGTLAGDWSFDVRKRVRLDGAEVAGRCLELHVTAYQTPPEGVDVVVGDLFHGAPPAE
ncbi:MAG: S8 family serine peptidase [Myxococcota bacterium]